MLKIAIIVISIFLILALGVSLLFIFRFKRGAGEQKGATIVGKEISLPFRWHYIAFPMAIFLISAAIALYFYPQLPQVDIATHFNFEGIPDGWSSRGTVMGWALAPQLVLLMMALGITMGMTKLGKRLTRVDEGQIAPGGILSFMGNILAVPQCIFCFKYLDIFWYHIHQTHIMPMWVFLIAILVIAGLVPLFLVMRTISKGKGAS
jgi:uncharacterized membrane protein